MFHFKRGEDKDSNQAAIARSGAADAPVHNAVKDGAANGAAPTDQTSVLPAQPLDKPLEGSDAEAYAALKKKRSERRRKKLIRRGIIAGVLVGIAAIIALIIFILAQRPAEDIEPLTDVVSRGTYSNDIEASGTLEAQSSTVITPEVDGTIAEVRVTPGQFVKKGDVLLVLKNDELDRSVSEAQRNLDNARTELSTAQRNLNQAQAAPTSVTDPQTGEVTETPQDTGSLKDAVDAAKRAVAAAQESYDQAVSLASKRTVTSPLDGNVVESNAKIGAKLSDIASAGNTLMQVADLSQMKVRVQVAEEDIAKVAVGQTGSVTFPAFDGLALNGTVTAIASVASGEGGGMYMDPTSSPTFAVDILISEPDARLKPGMTASVTLTTERYDDVIIVPSIALMTDDGTHYYVNRETDAETHASERVDVEVVAQNDSIACIGKPTDAAAPTDGDPNTPADENAPQDPNAGLPTAALNEGDILVVGGGAPDEDGGAAFAAA